MHQTRKQTQKKLSRIRSSTRQFLVFKTDSKPAEDKTERAPLAGLDDLSFEFTDILSGKSFADSAADRLKSSLKFCAMAIGVDNSNPEENLSGHGPIDDKRVDVARTIDVLCKSENGMWGRVDHDSFGCFFSEKDAAEGLLLAKRVHERLEEHPNEAVIIGLASYPALNFTKSQILENARKALVHAAFFGPGSTVSFDAVSLNISADKLYQEGDINEAIKEFKNGLLLDPSNVNIRNSLGVCYGVLGDFEKAMEEFETAIWLDPIEIMAIYNLGLVNLLMGHKDKALELFLEADHEGEEVFEVVFQIGKLYLETEKPEKGREFLEKAVRLRPESGIGFRYLGQCYATLNKTDKAVPAYKKAVKLNPNDSHSLSALGYLFEVQDENSEIATVFCKKSIEISPENGLFRHRLGRLYLKQNQLEDALKEFIEATKLGHDSTEFIEIIQSRLNAG